VLKNILLYFELFLRKDHLGYFLRVSGSTGITAMHASRSIRVTHLFTRSVCDRQTSEQAVVRRRVEQRHRERDEMRQATRVGLPLMDPVTSPFQRRRRLALGAPLSAIHSPPASRLKADGSRKVLQRRNVNLSRHFQRWARLSLGNQFRLGAP